MTSFTIPGFDLGTFVAATLDEDLGVGLPGGGRDVTSESVIAPDMRFSGVMDSRHAITVAGLPIAAAFFRKLDPAMKIDILVSEGTRVSPGTDLMHLSGNARAMLTAERSALNTVQHLSGVATLTREYVDAMGDGTCVLLDTRKTI
ncbi:MAG: nicotinate-nucleotide diphosphorylase (carboxylating), partial [Rhizobiaceae bacterium]